MFFQRPSKAPEVFHQGLRRFHGADGHRFQALLCDALGAQGLEDVAQMLKLNLSLVSFHIISVEWSIKCDLNLE